MSLLGVENGRAVTVEPRYMLVVPHGTSLSPRALLEMVRRWHPDAQPDEVELSSSVYTAATAYVIDRQAVRL